MARPKSSKRCGNLQMAGWGEMLLYRVFPHLDLATSPAEPGHALYVHRPQSSGRLDNPADFSVWYLAAESSGAIGEVFGDLHEWTEDMFKFPALDGARRCLGTYLIPDTTALLDLDDSYNLYTRGLRPTQVVERNRSATRAWAKRVWDERGPSGERCWSGVRWWSYHRPQWRIIGLWGLVPEVVQVEALSMSHPAIVDAGQALSRVATATVRTGLAQLG